MKRILSSIGIGAATVDTVLPSATLTAGEPVEARVDVRGGSTEQEVDSIYFALLTRYATDEGYSTGLVHKFTLAESFAIAPDEERSFDVTIDVPPETPVTLGRTDVWVETGLDIKLAVDPDDTDPVEVHPGPRMRTLFDAVEDLGFTLRTAECRAAPGGLFGGRRFVQEFEFRPTSGPFAGTLDELEVVCLPSADALEVRLEIDRRGGLLSEMMDVDERMASLTVGDESVSDVRSRLESIVANHA
ncbi:sporulation protein [Halomarina pelagica]|uniref:sporulation protein n=1 Tax=Halomarina pelagica TaxID=2961599 RepID=UPI0020C4E5EB|nr:sporulation protein [Halomarina sp. BND7]